MGTTSDLKQILDKPQAGMPEVETSSDTWWHVAAKQGSTRQCASRVESTGLLIRETATPLGA